MILSPSLLAADTGALRSTLIDLQDAGLSWVHWDVMDGIFVPNITFGQHLIKALRPTCSLFFDVHLMIAEPERYLEDFKAAGADMLVVHIEASKHIHRTINEIKRLGMQAGIAINPGTSLSALDDILHDLDMVLLMSVNPGFGGQHFIEHSYDKLTRLHKHIQATGRPILIEIDGGVTPDNAAALVAAGADVLVSGSAFFNGQPYTHMLEIFEKSTHNAKDTYAKS